MGTHWIVSTHATSYPNVVKGRQTIMHPLVQIPAGVSIHFYCKEGSGFDKGDEMLKLLVNPSTAEAVAKQWAYETRTGLSCPDYWIWGDDWRDRIGPTSGIFKIGQPRWPTGPADAGIAGLAKGDFSVGKPPSPEAEIARLARGDFTRGVLSNSGGLLAKGQYIRLSTVLRWCSSGDHIHWLACRRWA